MRKPNKITPDINACLQLITDLTVTILLEKHRKDPLLNTKKVRAYVSKVLAEQQRTPLADEVAEIMNCSNPTLRRHLFAEGTSYQSILDEVRLELAKKLLGRLTVEDVAYDLGFSAPSGFSRAFSQWTGTPPSAWRNKAA